MPQYNGPPHHRIEQTGALENRLIAPPLILGVTTDDFEH
jgi:hypothetical protein